MTSGPYPVTKVVDGDTLCVQRNGQTVKLRLIGIDTPETHDPRKPVQCFGEAAAAQARSRLAGHQVLLETDDSQGLLDKYGRELVYVWVDGQLFNLEMIKAGFTHEYTYDAPYRYQQQFQAAQLAAAASMGQRHLRRRYNQGNRRVSWALFLSVVALADLRIADFADDLTLFRPVPRSVM